MSLTVDGVWKAGVWASTVWGENVWYEPAVTTTEEHNTGGYHRKHPWQGPRALSAEDRKRLSEQARALPPIESIPEYIARPPQGSDMAQAMELGEAIEQSRDRIKALEAEQVQLQAAITESAHQRQRAKLASLRKRIRQVEQNILKENRDSEELLVLSMFFDDM